jgi:AcrR family transcriptional regulator
MTAPAAAALTPRGREIVAAARELLEQKGRSALSMRRLAARLGVRAPSLYEHLPNKQALEAALISDGLAEWAALAEQAVQGGGDRLAAVARAFRAYALQHPHLYRLMTERPLERRLLAPGVEGRAAQPVLDAVGGDADTARALWAFLHGMAINELNGRFPGEADLNAAWERGVSAFQREAAAR